MLVATLTEVITGECICRPRGARRLRDAAQQDACITLHTISLLGVRIAGLKG